MLHDISLARICIAPTPGTEAMNDGQHLLAAFDARTLLFGRNYHLLAERRDECFVGILDDPVSEFVVDVIKFAGGRTRDHGEVLRLVAIEIPSYKRLAVGSRDKIVAKNAMERSLNFRLGWRRQLRRCSG